MPATRPGTQDRLPLDQAMFSEAEFMSRAQDLDRIADAAVRVFLAAYASR